MISLLLFGMMVAGPTFYYSSLRTNAMTKYDITMKQSRNTTTFQIADTIIEKAGTLQSRTENMASGNIFTDFVNMMVVGQGVLSIIWDFTGIFTNIPNEFIDMIGFGGQKGWIAAGIAGIVLIVITAKVLSIVLNREV